MDFYGLSQDVILQSGYSIPVFIFLYVICAVFFIPASPLVIISGVIWGTWTGAILSSFATSLSVFVTYLISLAFFRKRTKGKIYQFFYKIEHNKENESKRFNKITRLLLLQINPLIPGASLGYYYGVIRAQVLLFAVVAFFATLPFNYVIAGAGSIFLTSSSSDMLEYIGIIVGLFFIYYYFKK